MRLNGWVRIWVVLSTIWVALIGYFAYEDFSRLYAKARYGIEHKETGNAQFLFSAEQSESEVESYFSKSLVPLIEKNPEEYVDKTDKSPYEQYVKEHGPEKARHYIAVAFIPALSLLALGWSVAWIRKGFRGADNA